MKRLLAPLSGLLWLLALGACPAAAAVEVEVAAGLDGRFRTEQWAPVWVRLANPGGEVSGLLQVEVPNYAERKSTQYAREIRLPAGSQQEHWLYIRPSEYGTDAILRLRGRGASFQRPLGLQMLAEEEWLIGVIGGERGSLSFLSAVKVKLPRRPPSAAGGGAPAAAPEVSVCYLDPRHLPDNSRAYQALDLLVLSEFSPQELSPEAKQALVSWVCGGGTLLVTGGPNAARLQDAFFRRLLPVEVTGTVSLAALGQLWPGLPAPDGAAVVTAGRPLPGAEVMAAFESTPLAVMGRAGAGAVIFLAYDWSQPPLKGWAGQADLWEGVLGAFRPVRFAPGLAAEDPGLRGLSRRAFPYGGYPGTAGPLANAIVNQPASQPPPFSYVGILMGAYLVLLVPVNYIILRRKKRLELAWVTVPVIVFGFSLIAYLVAYGLKGGAILVTNVAVAESGPGAQEAEVTGMMSLFSPGKRSYDLAFSAPQALGDESSGWAPDRARDRPVFLEGDTLQVPRVPIDMWAMRAFRIEAAADLGRGLECDLESDGAELRGQLVNHTGRDLEACEIIWHGRGRHPIGNLARGEKKAISVGGKPALSGAPSPPAVGGMPIPPGMPMPPGGVPGRRYAPAAPGTRQVQIRNDVAEGIRAQAAASGLVLFREAVLVGWSKEDLLGLELNGRKPAQEVHSCFIFHLPCRYTSARIEIPYGSASASYPESSADLRSLLSQAYWPSGPFAPPAEAASLEARISRADPSGSWFIKELTLAGVSPRLAPSELFVRCQWTGNVSLSVSVFDWKKKAWRQLVAKKGDIPVTAAADCVKLPEGRVRAKLSWKPLAGGQQPFTLQPVDIRVVGTS